LRGFVQAGRQLIEGASVARFSCLIATAFDLANESGQNATQAGIERS
jgi:hypothetical protein